MPDERSEDGATVDDTRTELPATAKRLLEGATKCFAASGYQATTTRDISNQASLSPGSLYVHFKSKEHLLHELIRSAHSELLTALRALPEPTAESALEVVVEQIRTVTHWHVDNHLLARVAQTELPNLSADHLRSVREQRAAIEAMLTAPVTIGRDAGVFRCDDPRLFVRAVLSLSIDVIRWYTPNGRYDGADLARSNVDILSAYLLHRGD